MPSKRHLLGVPKAGDLYVNGVKVPKGNVRGAISRMYRSTNTRAEGTADVVIARPWDVAADTRCGHCLGPASGNEALALEVETGAWWHMGPCRSMATRT